MLTKNIKIRNFSIKISSIKKKQFFKLLNNLIRNNNQIFFSMGRGYKDKYTKKLISRLKKIKEINLIGIGGSILGAKAIYNFLRPISKKFNFIDNFSKYSFKKGNKINLIISKSGNTLETIANSNIYLNKSCKNIFITENKKSYLMDLANKLKAEIIYHNNYIGGRYSVLSEVGMLPAQLMGFKPEKFRRYNDLIKNKKFLNNLVENVLKILILRKKNKTNSIVLNYDENSHELFLWYQQLVAESLGKKSKGILPMISEMPRDNHSLMQYYLDGTQNHFFTLFFAKEKNSKKIINNSILKTHNYLKYKNLNDILYSQFCATQNVFLKKKIPFRSLIISKKNEETLGELFTFFILETILLGKAMNLNPFDQPAVELIKRDTVKFLKNI